MTQLKFTKMHGIGNDYIYIDCIDKAPEFDPTELSPRLCDRNYSIGGNGLVLILPSEIADYRMKMFNADGSEGAMCGNAIRCVGKYLYEHGYIAKTDRPTVTIQTASGIKQLNLLTEDGETVTAVQVDMGTPVFSKHPVTLQVGRREYTGLKISMGNPHYVIFCEDVLHQPVTTDGPYIETMSCFPDRTNVEFVEQIGENRLRMRVWERGSGETMACGTGACAAAVSAVLQEFCSANEPITVELPGGNLEVIFDGSSVYMTGPAEQVFEGLMTLKD